MIDHLAVRGTTYIKRGGRWFRVLQHPPVQDEYIPLDETTNDILQQLADKLDAQPL